MTMNNFFAIALLSFVMAGCADKSNTVVVPQSVMEAIFDEVKTPYKYGIVLAPEDNSKMVDSPSVFRHADMWYMTYIIYDGQGYESWIASSRDLLRWETLGRIMSFTTNTWDANQKAGYIALQDYTWGGSYEVGRFDDKYWMSYLGGSDTGYETGTLSIGMANTDDLVAAKEWNRLSDPVISPRDGDTRWYDSKTIYKSTVLRDESRTLGGQFVMYYNAANEPSERYPLTAERIAIAVSDDMVNWHRYGDRPAIDHFSGISGDAQIAKIDDVWVMFYFGAFWRPGAFERFACSYDMVNWTLWDGADLIAPTAETYDEVYAHKPCVVKYNGIVYHFYCAVGRNASGEEARTIALATSVDLNK